MRTNPRVLVLQIVCYLITACVSGNGNDLYSLDEALSEDIPLPLYTVSADADPKYLELDVIYHYKDQGGESEIYLYTYFTTTNTEGETIRVAEMMICSACTAIGDVDEPTGGQVPTSWANDGIAGTCKVPESNQHLPFSGDPFESCLYWIDEDLHDYKLYTVWPEDEVEAFLQSLQRVSDATP